MRRISFNSSKMGTVTAIGVVLSIQYVVPISMYYMFDENMGYYSSNSLGEFSKTKLGGYKKYFPGNNVQRNSKLVNERVVESHFAVLRSTPNSIILSETDKMYSPKTPSNNDEKLQEKKDSEEKPALKSKEHDIYQYSQARTLPPVKKESYKPIKQDIYNNHREYLGNSNGYDLRNSAIHDYSPYLSPESQNIPERKPNKPANIQNYKPPKPAGPGIKDKVLHKTNLNMGLNSQIMSRALDDLSVKLMDRPQKQRENRKRDIEDKVSIEHIPENIKKFMHKDANAIKRESEIKLPSRIGNYETDVEERSMPYAVFYKMSHENIEPHDFYTGKDEHTTIEEHDNTFYDKEKLMVPIENEVNNKNKKNLALDMNTYANFGAFQDR